MLVDENLADVGRTIYQEIPFVHPDPENPEVDPDTGQPRTTDFLQHSARAIERHWSEAAQAAIGVYKLHEDPRPTGLVIATERREFREVDGVQRAYRAWDVTPMPATRDLVGAELHRRRIETTVVTLEDGRSVPVDTRGDSDLITIQSVYDNANRLNSQGLAETIPWVGADNAVYPLDVDEQIDMAVKVFGHQRALVRASHAVKGQVEAGTLTDAPQIEAAFDAALAAL